MYYYIMIKKFFQEGNASTKMFAPLNNEPANRLNDSSYIYQHIIHRSVLSFKKMTSSLRFSMLFIASAQFSFAFVRIQYSKENSVSIEFL